MIDKKDKWRGEKDKSENLPSGHQLGKPTAFCKLHSKLFRLQMHCKELFPPLHH